MLVFLVWGKFVRSCILSLNSLATSFRGTIPFISFPMANSIRELPVERLLDGSGDEVYVALADECRRRVLHILASGRCPVDVRTIATEVARRDRSVDEDRVLVMLNHVHLPRLAEADLISYDPAAGIVEDVAPELTRPAR